MSFGQKSGNNNTIHIKTNIMKNSTLLHGKRNDAMNKISRKRVNPLTLVVLLLAVTGFVEAQELTIQLLK